VIRDITESNLSTIKNPALRSNAEMYVRIYQDFMDQIRQAGIEIAEEDHTAGLQGRLATLKKRGAKLRNNKHSVSLNEVSAACKACRTSVGSATFFVSLQCHRDCYYCFNPYQENYEYFRKHTRDVVQELDELAANGSRTAYLALTGGEPLLHKEETIQFFEKARDDFPGVHTRLYTTGDQLDQELLQSLKDAGLQEIRFSIRMHDSAKAKELTFQNMALAREYIPEVMVEMPVLPDTLDEMKQILLRLDEMGIYSINLLEFCFPLHNADEFRVRGYKIKARPYHVLYDYWYAGGLPVAGSEEACLDLVEFALKQELRLGVHYCSLENKHTGQIYQQNEGSLVPETAHFSQRDYFLKTAMVFGEDIAPVKATFDARGYSGYRMNADREVLEFHVKKIKLLKELDVEVGISTAIHETREGEDVLRELKLDVTTPKQFKLSEV
jgi:pyruvate formate-lyase activating enzyme-like uncharacterized protein